MTPEQVAALKCGDAVVFPMPPPQPIKARAVVTIVTDNFVRVDWIVRAVKCYDVLHKASPLWRGAERP